MLYCPYCGTHTNKDEEYCITCGKNLPSDLDQRLQTKKTFNRYWYLPMMITLCLLLAYPVFYFILHNKETNAKSLYEQGENLLLDEVYEEAEDYFSKALIYKDNFREAKTALDFTKKVAEIEKQLNQATKKLKDETYNEALSIVNHAENTLKNYHGTAVTPLINQITARRDLIKIEQLEQQITNEPSIDTLKILLWEAEAIKNDEAEEITSNIRSEIVDYTFSKASEQLNNNQFNDAQILVDDGLKYVTDSEKLQSLKTTIEKEKTAFETAQQQRIEQAVNIATEEQEKNKSDAVTVDKVNIKNDDKGKWTINGEVSSMATVPINSILIRYTLLSKSGQEILSNKVFSFPDTLYTNETGKFEFTHYDINDKYKSIQVKVDKITWYTD